MRTARAWGLGLLVACTVVLSSTNLVTAQEPPDAQAAADEEARVHFRLGVAYHDSGRFAEAAAEFVEAYELSKRPKLLYNVFLAYRDGGNIAKAADALQRYLTLEEDVPERDKLTARLAALERILESQQPQAAEEVAEPKPQPEPHPQPVAESEPETPSGPQMERNPWHRYAPWVTMGTGVAMVGVGAAMGSIALSDYNSCESGSCSASELSSGQTKARVADAMLFGGAAVAATGLVLYFLLPREREVRTTGGVACGPGGCGVSVSHRF